MVKPQYQCTKKDKRLLVLFSLGLVILFLDLDLARQTETEDINRTWLELKKGKGNNIVVSLSRAGDVSKREIHKLLQIDEGVLNPAYLKADKHFFAMVQDYPGQFTIDQLSPRLAFFLGRPFSVNRATVEDLILINGIGPSLANKIISYRENHGLITSETQLQKINGIGPMTSQKLNKYLTYTTQGETD